MKEQEDLFEKYEDLPEEVQAIILTFEDETYDECKRLEAELKPFGYVFDWGLDAQPYNLRKMDYITIDDVKDLTIAGYTSDVDGMSGGLCWTHPNFKVAVYATPNWDNEDGSIPFAYEIDGDEHVHLFTIKMVSDMSKEAQLRLYINTLNFVMEFAESVAKDLEVSK
jgi:hypothetical protein